MIGVLLPLGGRMWKTATKVGLCAAIRRNHRAGLSGRALERGYGMGFGGNIIEAGTASCRLARTQARAEPAAAQP
ncbi:hypothetical protein [Streptomyces sp. NPDC048419]|uniref:hypothetical protein n=1 Tax=Streptomyces sp. NPDC048419 TaxID=3365547 RepID=UPI00371BEA74